MEAVTVDALVIFVDARGFTSWAEKVDVFSFIDEFGQELHRLLSKHFPDYYIKNLGDGGMLIQEIDQRTTVDFLKRLLLDTLRKISKTDKDFSNLCKEFSVRYGCRIPLSLGWGVTKGRIKKLSNDYIGADINKSSRLCGIARPYGIVIDRDDFPVLPKFSKNLDVALYEQVRKLKGIAYDINVWVTKEIANQLISRESLRETPEVHVAGVCIKNDNGIIRALIAKRNASRTLFPNLFEGCGGQLARNELFTTGIKRHFKLEFGIEVDVIEDVHKFYYIQQAGEPIIPGIRFLCKYQSGQPHSENHSDIKWVTEDELKNIPDERFIQGVKNDFVHFMKTLQERKSIQA